MLVERYRTTLADHHLHVAAHLIQPLAELFGVTHRRRQTDQLDRLGQPEDDLLPDRTAETVGEIVHLIHHHVRQPGQHVRTGVDHVAKYLGRHHDQLRLWVHRRIAGQQAHPIGPVPGHQVVVLLVAQRLDGCGVEALGSARQRQPAGELPHHRLTGTSWGGHQHTLAVGQLPTSHHLEIVEGKVVASGEFGQGVSQQIPHPPRSPGRWARKSAGGVPPPAVRRRPSAPVRHRPKAPLGPGRR